MSFNDWFLTAQHLARAPLFVESIFYVSRYRFCVYQSIFSVQVLLYLLKTCFEVPLRTELLNGALLSELGGQLLCRALHIVEIPVGVDHSQASVVYLVVFFHINLVLVLFLTFQKLVGLLQVRVGPLNLLGFFNLRNVSFSVSENFLPRCPHVEGVQPVALPIFILLI